jgi:hypothetical protein
MIFVSYSWADAGLVHPLVRWLHDRGLSCWVDFRDLDLAHDLRTQLKIALFRCDAVVLFDSCHSRASEWVEYERQIASVFRKRCIRMEVSEIETPGGVGGSLDLVNHFLSSGSEEATFVSSPSRGSVSLAPSSLNMFDLRYSK